MRVHARSGIGIVALGNGTYCRAASPCASALHHLISNLEGSVQARAEAVISVGTKVAELVLSGNLDAARDLITYNVLEDTPPEVFARDRAKVFETLGKGVRVQSVACISGYQGEVVFSSETGTRKLSYSLAPCEPLRVQSMSWVE
jgi:hypothetical protein